MVCIFRTADPNAVDWTDELIGSFQNHLDTTDDVREHCAMSNLGMRTFGDVGVSIIFLQLCKINIWHYIKRKCGRGVKQENKEPNSELMWISEKKKRKGTKQGRRGGGSKIKKRIQENFGKNQKWFVGGVASWSFVSHTVPC